MSEKTPVPNRWIGLDGHKHYLVAGGVDAQLEHVLGPQRVQLSRLDAWARKTLTPYDSLALEMSTNSFDIYDDLVPYVHSMILVHPPHVSLITRAQVKTDNKSAFALARLHAAGLLPAVWVPPLEVRDRRALISQRAKMVRLSTQAKNRLHAVIHRHHLAPPECGLFASAGRDWWLDLDLSPAERARILSDLDTLDFAQGQVARFEKTLATVAASDDRVLLLIQLPGVGLVTALTLLSAIGDISRFPAAKCLVGYAVPHRHAHGHSIPDRHTHVHSTPDHGPHTPPAPAQAKAHVEALAFSHAHPHALALLHAD
jgi:transposase